MIDYILSIMYPGYPKMDECKSYVEQLTDFDNYWPNMYSAVVRYTMATMAIGYYFFPALLFDRQFRRRFVSLDFPCC